MVGKEKGKIRLFISQYVLDEASKGDSEAAERRMNAISHIEMLEVDNDVILLAEKIMQSGIIPPKADTDALHIAVASRHSIDFLLTWNCTHIANAEILVKINHIVTESGYFRLQFARLMNFLEEKIMNDPIVAEIRENRMKILESYDWDFKKMSRDVIKRQFESGHKIVSFGRRTPQQGAAPNAYAPSGHP